MGIWTPARGVSRAAIAVILLATACSKPPPVTPAPTLEDQLRAAAEILLECMGTSGTDCLHTSPGATAWIAHGDLQLLERLPAALVPNRILRAADELESRHEVVARLLHEAENVVPRTIDLSCRATAMEPIGARFARRRRQLHQHARRLGLDRTAAGPALQALLATAAQLDGAQLVTASCRRGAVYLLMSPPTRELEPDDDPAAYPGGGWEPAVVGTDQRALLGGAEPQLGAAATPVPISDQAPAEAIDPWLPFSGVEL